MDSILVFILGVALGCAACWLILRKSARQPRNLTGFNTERNEKEEQNKQKILTLLVASARISNNDVQKLLGVSDATATRYLEKLEQEGELKQVQDQGRGVYYQKP